MKYIVFLLFFSCSLESKPFLKNEAAASSSTGNVEPFDLYNPTEQSPNIEPLPTMETIITEAPSVDQSQHTENPGAPSL